MNLKALLLLLLLSAKAVGGDGSPSSASLALWGIGNLDEHKFYVSLTDIRFNEESNQVEVALKIFIDDFEMALGLDEKKSGWHITEEADRNLMAVMSDYLNEHLKVELDSEQCTFEVLGHEIDEEVVWVYLESNKMNPPTRALVYSTVLLDSYEEQQNIVHFDYQGSIRSLFLSRAHTEETIDFK